MGKGTLIVEVYASNAVIPLSGARIFVTSGDDSELLGTRKSNIVGKTEPLEIAAPDKELSMEPGNSRPFTQVNVYVQLAGYYNILINGVQIFSGQESIQPVRMIPLPANYTGDNTEIITIPPQNL